MAVARSMVALVVGLACAIATTSPAIAGEGRADGASPGSRTPVTAPEGSPAANPAAAQVGATPLPACAIGDRLTADRGYGAWATSILDWQLRLPSGYAPRDLRSTASAGIAGGRVRALVLPDLQALVRAGIADGVRLAIQSSYRSYATQAHTFAYWVGASSWRTAVASSARAGHSEHQLGTVLDFRSAGGPAPWNLTDWARTKAGAWMAANGWRYGFVMSYPKGESAATCYQYEPWHYRYVGRDLAAQVHEAGLTLREFLWARAQAAD